jgi:hypothetical protein
MEREIIKAFSEVTGIQLENVKITTSDCNNQERITLSGTAVTSNDQTETRLTITETSRNEFRFEGSIKTNSGLRESNIDKTIKGVPQSLPRMVKAVLATAKVRKGLPEKIQNQVKSYLNL